MNKDRLDFAWNVHEYLRQFIQFADIKAGFVFAWCNGALGILAKQETLSPFFKLERWVEQPVIQLIALVASLFLVISTVVAVLTIYPKLDRRMPAPEGPLLENPGLIYWGDILSQSEEAYVREIAEGDEATEEVARHCYTLAGIVSRKYQFLKLSMCFALLGTALAMGAYLFVK